MVRLHNRWRGGLKILHTIFYFSDLAYTASHHAIWLLSGERGGNISDNLNFTQENKPFFGRLFMCQGYFRKEHGQNNPGVEGTVCNLKTLLCLN